MGQGNLALSRSFPGEGPDFANCRVSSSTCTARKIVFRDVIDAAVPTNLLPMAHHRRSTDSAVAIGLRLRDKAPAPLLTGAGRPVGPSKSGTFDDRGG
jgi:hypothetical protein